MTGNYQLVYYVAQKYGNYRDTGVSKKIVTFLKTAKPLRNIKLSS